MIEYILNPQFVEALGWTLLHSVWQGAAFAIFLVLILIGLRSYTAQSRYIVAVGILGAFFLTVSITFWQQWQDVSNRMELSDLSIQQQQLDEVLVLNNSHKEIWESNNHNENTDSTNNEILTENKTSWILVFKNYYKRHLPLLVTIWFLGILFLQLRFLGQLAYVQRLRHYGTQILPEEWKDKIEELEGKLRIQKKVGYFTSLRIQSPMVIGWLKPVVLLPKQLLHSLSETEIYAVLAHELAHIRREDFIVNLVQTFLCNLFFFHPGVWWMSHRIDDEREHCCDDLAIAASGPAISYAKTLINVSELNLRMIENPSLAMALSGKTKKRERGGFTSRIHRLFSVRNSAGTFKEGFATACILVTALFLGVAATERTTQVNEDPVSDRIETILNDAPSNTIGIPPIGTTTSTNKIEATPTFHEKPIEYLDKLPILVLPPPVSPSPPQGPETPSQPDGTRIDALVMACGEGDFEFVKSLINSGIDINGIGSKGFTPLMMATSKNEAEIVAYLLKKGAAVNQKFNGWTALIEAADEGSLASMTELLKAGAEIDYYWTQGSPTAITMAAAEGRLQCLQLLLEFGADINGIGKSLPPLHTVAAEGKRNIINYLISKNVNINKIDASGRTALMYAAAQGNKGTVKKLLESGADKSISDSNGNTAKDYAEVEEKFDVVDLLVSRKRPNMHEATSEGYIEKVQKMAEEGMEKERKKAVSNARQREINKNFASEESFHIHENGSHLRQFNLRKKVPDLFKVVRNGTVANCRQLLNHDGTVNTADDTGQTALMVAASINRLDMAKLLIEHGADLNKSSASGLTALHYAALENHDEMAKLLIQNKAYIDPTMQYSSTDGNFSDEPVVWEYLGATPLLIAVESGNLEVLSVLIKAGANKTHTLTRNEYRLSGNRASFLTRKEVIGIDKNFLKSVEIRISDDTWSPYKQALLSEEASIMAFFKN